MAENTTRASRRFILRTGLRTGLTILAASVGAEFALAQDKIAPSLVQYQPQPKNGQKCADCQHFAAPNACKLVSGYISPNGWCSAFAKKEG